MTRILTDFFIFSVSVREIRVIRVQILAAHDELWSNLGKI
jgi:hypothetical protein